MVAHHVAGVRSGTLVLVGGRIVLACVAICAGARRTGSRLCGCALRQRESGQRQQDQAGFQYGIHAASVALGEMRRQEIFGMVDVFGNSTAQSQDLSEGG